MNTISFTKTRTVQSPIVSTNGAAGIDFFVPHFNAEQYVIKPHADVLIPSGIKVKIPAGTCLLAVNKSGVARNNKLQVGACLIDEDYEGEIHLHVFNFSDKETVIYPNQKLVQFIHLPYIKSILIESTNLDFGNQTNNGSDNKVRGDKGFGSTQTPYNGMPKIELTKTTAVLIKRNSNVDSKWMGKYQRHFFRDIKNSDMIYILDVTAQTSNIFKGLPIGTTLTNLDIMSINGKNYINGKSKAVIVPKTN